MNGKETKGNEDNSLSISTGVMYWKWISRCLTLSHILFYCIIVTLLVYISTLYVTIVWKKRKRIRRKTLFPWREIGKNSMFIADAERAQRCAVSSQPRGDRVPKRPALSKVTNLHKHNRVPMFSHVRSVQQHLMPCRYIFSKKFLAYGRCCEWRGAKSGVRFLLV